MSSCGGGTGTGHVAVDSKGSAGAPAADIEITSEMIEAGTEEIWRFFYDSTVYGTSPARELAGKVYSAMSALGGRGQTIC
jgi:hypothetical protein